MVKSKIKDCTYVSALSYNILYLLSKKLLAWLHIICIWFSCQNPHFVCLQVYLKCCKWTFLEEISLGLVCNYILRTCDQPSNWKISPSSFQFFSYAVALSQTAVTWPHGTQYFNSSNSRDRKVDARCWLLFLTQDSTQGAWSSPRGCSLRWRPAASARTPGPAARPRPPPPPAAGQTHRQPPRPSQQALWGKHTQTEYTISAFQL